MQLVLLIGVQASGKSTFYRERFAETHLRLSLDMLRTRHRESVLFAACLEAKQPVVIDNTNPSRAERERYVTPAKAARFEVVGYYFRSVFAEAAPRNANRSPEARVPEGGLLGTLGRLERPSLVEGFDRLCYVRPDGAGGFLVDEWRDDL
jgi:predicted kinase